MPPSEVIINLPGFTIISMQGYGVNLTYHVESNLEAKCLYCSSLNLRCKDSFWRTIRHTDQCDRHVFLKLKCRKFRCNQCFKYFNQRFTGVLPYQRVTEAFKKQVSRRHWDGIPQSRVAVNDKISHSSVHRYFLRDLYLEGQKLKNAMFPKVIGIDEHFFTRKQGYATTIADLRRRKVFDVLPGRSELSLKQELLKIAGRDRVKVVCMDLSTTYRSIATKYFPNALIVADRFHVIRLINQKFMELWKQLDAKGRYNRGLLSLMRRHYFNLREDQKINLNKYLHSIPGLHASYWFKQGLAELMLHKHLRRYECVPLVKEFLQRINQLDESGFECMRQLGKTLDDWKDEIVRMWRFTKNNSITEGLHNKIERVQRQACGFRNFANYRTRVKVMCA